MPRISGLLHNGKPIVQAAVAEAVPAPGAVVPTSSATSFELKTYRALLDTGADISAISHDVVCDFGLRRTGSMPIVSGSGSNLHQAYVIRLGIWCEQMGEFDGEGDLTRTLYQLPQPLQVIRIAANAWFDIIIGTDVIGQHELRVKRDRFTFILGES